MFFRSLIITLILISLSSLDAVAAEEYYVSTIGNDNNIGSLSKPWKSLAYAESQISAGDTVIVRGGKYNRGVKIDVPNTTFRAYSGELPVIDGVQDWPVWPPPRHPSDLSDLPPYRGESLIHVCADNVTVDGFKLINSIQVGIRIGEQDLSKPYIKDVTVRNIEAADNYANGVVVKRAMDVLIEDCTIHGNALVFYYWDQSISRRDPPQVIMTRTENVTFRRNKVFDSYNEGVNVAFFSRNTTVEYCEIYGNRKMQLYTNSSDGHTLRYNVVYGTVDSPRQEWVNPGIMVNNETKYNKSVSQNFRIYGNVVANCSPSLWIAGATDRLVNNALVYNNTFVMPPEAEEGILVAAGEGHQFKNNIIWKTGGNGRISTVRTGGVAFDYNLWSEAPVSTAMGNNDPPYGIPRLAKNSNFSNLTRGSIHFDDFALLDTSPAINKGSSLGSDFELAVDCKKSYAPQNISLVMRPQHNRWDIGADELNTPTSPSYLNAPKLRITFP
jgi:hypothetical protein